MEIGKKSQSKDDSYNGKGNSLLEKRKRFLNSVKVGKVVQWKVQRRLAKQLNGK